MLSGAGRPSVYKTNKGDFHTEVPFGLLFKIGRVGIIFSIWR